MSFEYNVQRLLPSDDPVGDEEDALSPLAQVRDFAPWPRRGAWGPKAWGPKAVCAVILAACAAGALCLAARKDPADPTRTLHGRVQRLSAVLPLKMDKASLVDCDKTQDRDPCKAPTELFAGGAIDGDTKDEEKCVWGGENCKKAKCCRNAGHLCYEQDADWAQCKPSCVSAPDPLHWNGKNWSCKELGPRAAGETRPCSKAGESCSDSQCCATPGHQCYQKQTGGWATCKASCTKGIDLTDANADPWTCAELGPRAKEAAAWVAGQCSGAGADCRKTKCCSQPGHTCYSRDAYWAQCRSTCSKKPDPMNPTTSWGCEPLGLRTPEKAPAPPGAAALADWVASTCAKTGDDCASWKCCSEAGMQCFAKNGTVARCKASCRPGLDMYDVDSTPWSCEAIGPRTPGAAKPVAHTEVAPWVKETCTESYKGCMSTNCCRDAGMQCFEKNEAWSTCIRDCVPGENRSAYGDTDAKPWSCAKKGPRTPRTWGSPSLFCFAVTRVSGYEPDLIKAQMAKEAGIFACDEFAVYSSAPYVGQATTWWHPATDDKIKQPMVSLDLGVGPLGRVKTTAFEPTYVGTSMDHTAGNTALFLKVWEKVKEGGQYLLADFTLKVDPDAVVIVPRMRSTLREFKDSNMYVVNCDKGGMAPMMFGSVEVFSKQALVSFFTRQQECLGGLGWKAWGEDYFMGKCLDMLGVKRSNLFAMVQDGVCKGVNCGDPVAAAFHPKKDLASWMACYQQASR